MNTSYRGVVAAALVATMMAPAAVPGVAFALPDTGEASVAASSVFTENKTWSFDPNENDELKNTAPLEGSEGKYDGISIDATADKSKFAPRSDYGDTQVNAGTILSVVVGPSEKVATLSITLSGGSTTADASVGDAAPVSVESSNPTITVPASSTATTVKIEFTSEKSYLASMSLTFNEDSEQFPGTPTDIEPRDTSWDFTSTPDDDGGGIQKTTGEHDGLKIDASSSGAKFDLRGSDVQVNANTIVYIPVAADSDAAELVITENSTATFNVTDGDVTLEAVNGVYTIPAGSARYVKVEFTDMSYLKLISLDYISDTSTYPGAPDGVEAEDMTWNLAATEGTSLPDINGTRGDWSGLRIDASRGGKFSGRPGNGDTQVNSGTIVYVPLAAGDSATLRIEATGTVGTDLYVDGAKASFGRDITVDASRTARYIKLEFRLPEGGTGSTSTYLTGISLDYASDDEETSHIVTVGKDGNYQTISDALEHETSSLKDHLVLSIAPGDYYERVEVKQPGVIFQNADESGQQTVTIRASYYSGNTWDADNNYAPKDDYDLGTAECATVLVRASGTGFTAYGITFQNDYNVVDHAEEGKQTPAVAFDSKADKIVLRNCSFIGRQDTLYVEGAGNRVYAENCRIDGTVDFIFGDADAYFDKCTINMVAFPGRTSGYYTAPNTKKGYTGLVFNDCTLTADSSLKDVYLGRPWQTLCYYEGQHVDDDGHTIYEGFNAGLKHPSYANVSSATTFIGCTMPSNLSKEHWSPWMGRTEDGKDTHSISFISDVRFVESNCTYPGGNAEGPILPGKFDDTVTAASCYSAMLMDGAWNPKTIASSLPYDDSGAVWPGTEPTNPPVVVPPVGGGSTGTPETPDYEPTIEEGGSGKGTVAVSTEKPEAGDQVVISANPDAGQEVRNVLVTDADGNSVEVTVNEDGTYSFVQPEGAVTIEVVFGCDGGDLCVAHGYEDVNEAQWYHDAVDWAVENGVMTGYGNVSEPTFGPDDELTRAQMAAVLYNIAGKPDVGTPSSSEFTDLAGDGWYLDAVAWASENGIFMGYSDGSGAFGPDNPLTREQAAVVLMRCAEAMGVDTSARADLSTFPDGTDVDSWAQDALSWAVAEGVLRGAEHSDGSRTLDAKQAITRAQIAALMMRLSESQE
ncbi:pectinesterase family protein [Collinsella sp. An2]|uniref:pectinesterase family protein n=1 Tax=Collinsella sp. An2 TaxID=1965585 RepID=UPI000B39324F|nr:pectinesterase family protein [Collinsella sp. An2]OUP07097.1 hypothetical protein B5F33_09445 [Collinsella sp. An2]